MRYAFLLSFFLTSAAFAQTDSLAQAADSAEAPQPYPVYSYVEQMPYSPYDANEFLAGMTRYPITALADSVEGTVYVQFNVTEIGLLDSVRVLRGVRDDLDQAALRTVRLMPAWRPGRKDGRAVAVRMVVPVRFRMPKLVQKKAAPAASGKAPAKAGKPASQSSAAKPKAKAPAKKGK